MTTTVHWDPNINNSAVCGVVWEPGITQSEATVAFTGTMPDMVNCPNCMALLHAMGTPPVRVPATRPRFQVERTPTAHTGWFRVLDAHRDTYIIQDSPEWIATATAFALNQLSDNLELVAIQSRFQVIANSAAGITFYDGPRP